MIKKSLLVILLLLYGCRNTSQNLNGDNINRLDKAVILYMNNWHFDDLFFYRAQIFQFLSNEYYDTNTINVVNQDTLNTIQRLVDLTDADTLKLVHDCVGRHYENGVCPWFAVLLYHGNEHIDTLSLPEGPLDRPNGYEYQYNNLLKTNTDTQLFDYISNIIRDYDHDWKTLNEDHYYEDGRYHDISKNWSK